MKKDTHLEQIKSEISKLYAPAISEKELEEAARNLLGVFELLIPEANSVETKRGNDANKRNTDQLH